MIISADVKNAESGHYSKMGKKRRAGSLQLNGQRKSEPTHINMKKAKVSSSLSMCSQFSYSNQHQVVVQNLLFFKMVFAHGSAIKVLTGIRMLMVITSQIGSTLSVIQSVLSDDEGRQQQVGSGNI